MRASAKLFDSARLFRAELFATLVLGAALVVALASVCCGLGAFAAPWFGCELFATQLAAGTGRRPPRTRAWLGAGLFLLGAVVIVASVAWLAALGLGPDMPVFEEAREGPDEARTVILFTGGALLALVFIQPFLYAPILLVDRGGTVGGAVLESTRLVHEGGALAHLSLSIASHLVQASPLIVAAVGAELFAGRAEVVWAVIGATPLLAITIPLGQGMIVSAWIERRELIVEPRTSRPEGRPTRALITILSVVLLSPIVSLGLVVISLARPSDPRSGSAPSGDVVIDAPVSVGETRTFPIATTALSVAVSDGWFSVVASDGGGAGELPRPGTPLQHLRVVRVRDAYAIEATTASETFVTWVSRAGVRLDDDLRARLADRLPLFAFAVLALALVITPLGIARVLVRLADLRRLAARGDLSGALAMRRPAARRAWAVAGALAPFAAGSLAIGLRAIAGG